MSKSWWPALLAVSLSACLMLLGWFGEGTSQAFAQGAGGQPGPPRMVDLLVGFDRVPGPRQWQIINGHGGRIKQSFWLVPAVAASVPENAVNALANARGVRVVEPDGQFHAIDHNLNVGDDVELDYAWGVKHIGVGPLLEADKAGAGVKVAIIDSGISSHIDLHEVAGGWNFVANNGDFADDNGHGTHVAGTVAAIRDGFGVVGVASDADLYALKVLGANGSGSFSNVIASLQWCIEEGIQVTNNSYGSTMNPGMIVQAAFDEAYTEYGIVHVAAAGNSGNPGGNNNTVEWPARYDSVIAVAATTQNDTRASFSSTGPALELSAPGVGIWSTWAGDGETWVQGSGTSMASPHVAGVAALLIAEGVTDPDLVRVVLATTAKPLGSANRFGAGLVQAHAAVAAVADDSGDDDPGHDDPGDDDPVEFLMIVQDVIYTSSGPQNRHLQVTVSVIEPAADPISGATVTATLFNTTTGNLWTYSGTTGSQGTVTFNRNNAPAGYYTLEIHSVVAEGWIWDGVTPENGVSR
jgi:subtilisin